MCFFVTLRLSGEKKSQKEFQLALIVISPFKHIQSYAATDEC